LVVDGEANRITLTFTDGSLVTLPYVARLRVEWPAGCPRSLMMSALKLIFYLFLLFTITFVLVGCDGTTQTGQLPDPLSHSTKGYELYSQQARDGTWRHTLITGAEELTAEEDTLTEDGWVKLTVDGVEALLDLLGRLPAGEQIFWHGGAAQVPAATETGQFRLPGEAVLSAVEGRCRDLDLQLIVFVDKLEAVLAMPKTSPTGEPVTLAFTLINHAHYPLYVLKWYTPLEGVAGKIFRITLNGQALPYQGILAMRGDPGPENYVLLAPGDSVTTTVNLSEAYDFSEAGTYTVTFLSPRISDVARTESEMARTVDELGPVTIVSNTVTTTVSTGE
jgi:hypothetical protein